MRTEKGDRMCKWQRGDAVARELAGKGKETAELHVVGSGLEKGAGAEDPGNGGSSPQ